MAYQIIKQPNGAYALYSSISDNFIMLTASSDEIIEYLVNEERDHIIEKVTKVIDKLNKKK